MHGREREYRKRIRHMRSAPTRGVTTTRTVPGDSIASTGDSFYKDGRRISVGDCALFEPPQNHPPFIGIIRWLSTSKDNNLLLGVSWLYRPSEVELGKGVLLDAEPNEIFYSFHKDEIPAASLLHPCKVAFLPKGVELSQGISSFVCRQVYDIANKCLWWLTDQDYIDERQEEVDKLLYKTRIEMHATVQPGGRSPKPLSVNTSTSQLKPASDNVQSSSTSYPSQVKRKKREHRDQGSEPSKRERSSKSDDGESAQLKAENVLKSEIAKITEKGGLINAEGVEKLVQLMQPDREERNMDLFSRSMLAGVIAATDRFDCLSWFVQLRGLPVLDEWLQDIHRGRIGDGSTRKNGDKSVEEFLLVLLRALDKLPVNLHALQMCNIGRSVNHLRTNKNLEIQKKARSLVDTWKKRVEAEMNSIDSKSASTQPVSWSSKSRIPEVSHGGNRHPVGSTEMALKSSVTQLSASKTSSSLKPVRGETTTTTKSASSSPRPLKGAGKDGQFPRISVGSASDLPLTTTTAREERSSSSSQSHNYSQSLSGKEDARSSTAGSMSVNKITSGTPQHQKLINGVPGPAVSGVQRETGSSRTSSLHRTSASGLTCEKAVVPVVEGNSRKLIVKIPNRGRSPAQSGSGASFEDRSVLNGRASSPVRVEKPDQSVSNSKEKGDGYRANITSDVNAEFCQSNDFKDLLTGSDEGGGSPDVVHDEERSRAVDDTRKSSEVSKPVSSSSGNELKLNEASFSSMNALIESCVSEANASLSGGDDVGIKLLASVAAGEISKSDVASPTHSPQKNTPVPENTCVPKYDRSESSPKDILARGQSQPDSSADADNDNGDRKISSLSSDEPPARNSCGVDLQPTAEPFIESSEKLDDSKGAASVAGSPSSMPEKIDVDVSNSEEKAVTNDMSVDGLRDIKRLGNSPLLAKDKGNDLRGSVEDEKPAVEVSPSSHLLENEGENIVGDRCDSGGYAEQKPPPVRMKPENVEETDEELLQSSSSVKNLVPEADEPRVVKAEKMDMRSMLVQAKEKVDTKTGDLKDIANQALVGSSSAHTNQKSECVEENVGHTEAREHVSQGAEPHGTLREFKVTAVEAEETEECASTTADISSFSASGPPQVDAKVKFDLNEGFVVDEGKFGDPHKLAAPVYPVHLMNQLPFPVSSVSISLPASITVAAAAKRPFLPPEDLLRSKGELGWKGSAATSAFRPAEPRKIQEVPLVTSNTPLPDATTSKHGRPLLDIDLNAPGELVLDDMETGSAFNCATRTEQIGSAPSRGSGGLDLDLNQVDEADDTEQYLTSNGRGLEFPLLPVKSSSSAGGFSGGEVRRDFDLNNGPAFEDVSAEPLFSRHVGSNMPSQPLIGSIRLNNAEMGNFSSWFAPGNTGLPVVVPSMLPNRGEKTFPGVASGGPQIIAPGAPQRILGPPTGGAHFTPDVYWGSVLSSSPTVPFPSTPFQYPVFPFGASFPLPSSTLSAGSASYMDSSTGGRICFPAIGSQVQGPPGGAGSSQYPRPYMVSTTLLDGSSNSGGVENNRKWSSRQGLDLNAGPGGADVEGREEAFSQIASRQLSFASPQALKEEQARMLQVAAGGGVLKRKEPDGGWDMEGFRYKQSSRQ